MRITWWLVCLILVGTALYALAEDLTLTTYYPSPRGVYKEVRIGDMSPTLPLTKANLYVRNLDPVSGLALRIDDEDDGGMTFERDETPFVVTNGGQVGIGTLTPNSAYKLDVSGIVNATDFYKNGAPFGGAGRSTPVAHASSIYYQSGCGLITHFSGAGCTGAGVGGGELIGAEDWDLLGVMGNSSFVAQSAINMGGICTCNNFASPQTYPRGCDSGYTFVVSQQSYVVSGTTVQKDMWCVKQ